MDARVRNVATALPQTCEWLRSHEQLAAWIDPNKVMDHHGMLWIKGKPGSGKSTIMKETLLWTEEAWAGQLVLSYFFNARAPGQLEKSSLGLYRSVMHQLLSTYEGVRPIFAAEFLSKEKDGRVECWREAELQNFILKLIKAGYLPCLHIFIDALDEGDENDVRQMVTFFETAAECSISAGSVFRLCFSSRHYPYISIERGLSVTVEEQPGHTRDIELYIEKTLRGRESQLMNDLRKMLVRKSSGIFLWVVLVVPILNQLYDRGGDALALKKKLESIPPSLHDFFTAVLMKNLEDLDECATLLQWVMIAMKPLSVVELYTAVKQKHSPLGINEINNTEHKIRDRYILYCSRGLVELTKGLRPKVQFIHETVRDSLFTPTAMAAIWPQIGSDSCSTAPDFRSETCHSVAAEVCLGYLLHISKKESQTQKVLEEYPLARYAAEYWWQHLQATNGMYSDRTLDLAVDLLTDSIANLLTWLQFYNIDEINARKKSSLVAGDLLSPIYYAALVGVPDLVTRILLLNGQVNVRGGSYGSALQAASIKGHEKVVQILLDKGADVNAQGGKYGNALQAASFCSDEKIVQILLDKGADVNAQGGYYGNALQAASLDGNEKVVRILLDKGAEVNAQGGYYGNALQAASFDGNEKLVLILLEKGADVDAQGGYYGNALQAASTGGYEKVLQILLDKGADVNAQGGKYGNALQAASSYGDENLVLILLDKGADVNAQGGYYGNALQAVSLYGDEEAVQMIIDKGADVDAQGGYYGNALQAASIRGREKVLQILLDKGGDVNAQGGKYGNALQAASSYGDENLVLILLDKGADVNAQGGYYGNALQAACFRGDEKVLQILLYKGAEVNAQGGYYGNALQAASTYGDEKVVQILLDKGADVNAQGGYYGNALQAASL